MRHDTPLRNRHEAIAAAAQARRPVAGADRPGAATPASRPGRIAPGVEWLPYGPPGDDGAAVCELVATYGAIEAEYAAIRRGAALMDAPHRATLRATGAERIAFLNRMVTQELKDLAPGMCRASFWLNRKGRIDADLLLCAEPGDASALVVDIDAHQAAATVASLTSYVFAEAFALVDDTPRVHRLALHGPEAIAALARASDRSGWTIERGAVHRVTIAGGDVLVARRDDTGEVGLHLFVPRDAVGRAWDALAADDRVVRPVGWHAFNVARIEAGTPLMNVDFDTSCLPHETGVLRDRVSFTKGCYLGQEVVARMQSLGRPKQTLVGLRIAGDVLPEAGGLVHVRTPVVGAVPAIDVAAGPGRPAPGRPSSGADAPPDALALGEPVGTITSSTISPMLGAAPVAFAMVKTAHAESGGRLFVVGEGVRAEAVVGPLRFWTPPGAGGAG